MDCKENYLKLKKIFGDFLLGLPQVQAGYIYFSGIDHPVRRYDAFNLLVIFTEIPPSVYHDFQTQLALIKKTHKNLPALSVKIFTYSELLNSLDVFPIELAEIQLEHELIVGTHVLGELHINFSNLRQECEFYLRTYLLKLREGLIQPKPNEADLIRSSFPLLISIFKFLLRLTDKRIPKETAEIILFAAKAFNFNQEVFYVVLNHLESQDLGKYINDYISEIDTIILHVDALDETIF